MSFEKEYWSKADYNEFINFLFKKADIKYRDFHTSLGVNKSVIGIRTPVLKDIAKSISKGNYESFLSISESNYYEEVIIFGFIICNIKDICICLKYLESYISKIDNWACCDLFCSNFKIVKKNKDFFWKYINLNINSDNIWKRRFCFVLILSYYIEDVNLNNIFDLCDKYNTNSYYVQMAVAWLISICYIKYPKDTIKYIKNNKLDDFTHNKTISKIRDSLRVSREDKDYLNTLKR